MSQITIITAAWCKPCEYLKANVENWAESVKCDIPIVYEEYHEGKHNIKKLPTLLYTYDGVEKQRTTGANEKNIRLWLLNAQAYGQFSEYGFED
tara:strand:+ start:636 stop:917 length:282 start_codon:yes stop_codon:yes gene_type:complete